MGWKVLFTDHVFPSIEPVQDELDRIGAELVVAAGDREAVARAAADADAVLNTYFPLDAELIERMGRCRIIARLGIGVDNVDVATAERRGIWVTNVPDYCIDEVADHTLALVLALLRKVTVLDALTRAGRWTFEPARPIPRLANLVLGLVGFGQIGRRVCQKSKAFGLHVLAYDPYVNPFAIREAGAAPADLDSLLASSDVVSIHVPLTAQTRHLLDRERIARMKPGAYLVNTSRGGIVDEAALREALDRGHLAGAALDVLEHEGAHWESPVRGHERVILTPHVAFYSEASVEELQRKAARQVVAVLSGAAPQHPVNRPAMAG